MSKESIKNYFWSQNHKAKTSKVQKNEPIVEKVRTMYAEEAIATGNNFDSEMLFNYLSEFKNEDYVESKPEVIEQVYKPDYSKYSIRLVEITDEMIRKKEQEEAFREEEEYFKSFQAYVPPPRPKEDIDEQIDKLVYQLECAKKELDEELIKPNPNQKGYCPPTVKKAYNLEFNPNVKRLNSNISDLENGIKQVMDKINKQNARWVTYRKIMYRSEYIHKKLQELSKMQEEIINSSNV